MSLEQTKNVDLDSAKVLATSLQYTKKEISHSTSIRIMLYGGLKKFVDVTFYIVLKEQLHHLHR